MDKQSIQTRIVTEPASMLWRLVAKLLLKACVPLVAIAGVLSYGVYLRGGDPGALWKSVADRSLQQFDTLFAGVQSETSRAVGAISNSAAGMTNEQQSAGQTEVFTWEDANGITHYSSVRPAGVTVDTVSVDPDVNVLAPVRLPVAGPVAAQAAGSGSQDDVIAGFEGRLPGVAGQVLATRNTAQASRDDVDQTTGLDPAQLLRMLQAADQ